ncbi:hypothetical protein RB195_005413 [Necator americanus]|uniref:Uncharacterized protein n=1 Tax=Necator americanus TaxID=51031 RepID=A0ABR1BQR4_NECAM
MSGKKFEKKTRRDVKVDFPATSARRFRNAYLAAVFVVYETSLLRKRDFALGVKPAFDPVELKCLTGEATLPEQLVFS